MKEFLAGHFAAALTALPADTASASTAIADYVLYYRARIQLELGMGKEALDLLRVFATRHADSPLLARTILDKARAHLILHNPDAALMELGPEQPKDNLEVLCLWARALEEAGRKTEAIQAYLQVFANYLAPDRTDLAERQLRVLAPNYVTRTENREILLRRGENLIAAGRNQEARSLLLRLESAPVPGPLREKQNVLLGEASAGLGRTTEALQYLSRVTDPALGARINYLRGLCYRGLGNEGGFLEARDRAAQLYPQSPYTEKLLYVVATYYEIDDQAVPARNAYLALARAFPKGEYAERSRWRSAMYFYIAGNYEEALGEFWQCFLANPTLSSAGGPVYMMARCCARLGHVDKAVSLYRRLQALANNSYYGQRAREALASLQIGGTAPTARAALPVDFVEVGRRLGTLSIAPMTIPPPSADARRCIERARQLIAAGVPELALTEIEDEIARKGGTERALWYAQARIYHGDANFLDAILSLRRAFPDYNYLPPSSLPGEIWNLFFPVRHWNVVSRYAARYRLDPNLILGLIRQESAFNETARSGANARGLMQLLPDTGRMLARQEGIAPYSSSRLYQPEINIALGARYLADRIKKYGGRTELALAAYNAGDIRVDRWLREFGNVDMAEFVELIPFSETRGYVKQVLSNLAHYHVRTAPTAAGPKPDQRKQ